MRKLVLFMHTSLDGFVAGPKGEMDWIKVDEEMFDYVGDRTNIADTALYGRVTYQMMEGYWPTAADQPNATRHDVEHARWYKQVAKVVVSRTLRGEKIKNTKIVSSDLPNEVAQLKQAPGTEIIMFGSPGTAHSLMKEDLIDDYWLFVNPILIGQGIPLFEGVKKITPLNLMKSHVFTSGVVCHHYERIQKN